MYGWGIRPQERSSPDRTPDRAQAHFVGMQSPELCVGVAVETALAQHGRPAQIPSGRTNALGSFPSVLSEEARFRGQGMRDADGGIQRRISFCILAQLSRVRYFAVSAPDTSIGSLLDEMHPPDDSSGGHGRRHTRAPRCQSHAPCSGIGRCRRLASSFLISWSFARRRGHGLPSELKPTGAVLPHRCG